MNRSGGAQCEVTKRFGCRSVTALVASAPIRSIQGTALVRRLCSAPIRSIQATALVRLCSAPICSIQATALVRRLCSVP